MPPTPECVLGSENRIRIEHLEKAVDHIDKAIDNLANHWSKRPNWLIVVVITFLTNAVTMLSAYVLLR